ncbi:immunoglobulin superfamily member 3 [Scleropages formosus]|uniref:immunoglobulin superfamily member 3 n=1 Tax=Scleropages formosus TaxID=113540 RepID=UPI0010FAC91B|nr:immunoglobulin superfamily member 3-like [Scleropages formosus]
MEEAVDSVTPGSLNSAHGDVAPVLSVRNEESEEEPTRFLSMERNQVAVAGPGVADRLVTIQAGPLVRTEGSHATIWCNVTGYRGAVVQDFEWSLYLASAPEREIRVVSTRHGDYSYAAYSSRVAAGDIYVERLSADAVVLHISRLQARDQGLFECYTPNTDGEYRGSYNAKTNLTVIPDTLSVTSTAQTLNKVEGDSLQLTCDVSRQTQQHTHLSVGWYLRSEAGAPPQDLLTLSRDFVLRAGGPYKQRFASGDLRLDKTGSTAYKLTVHRLQPADQGLLYCEAAEWIQDPDRSWYAMTRKQSEKTVLKIQPAEKDFSIQVSTERRAYTAGEPLELRCSIDAQNVQERYFSVSWVFSSSQVAVVGPNAVPVLVGDYVQREATGQLTVRKESPSVYLLKLQSLRPEDTGKYTCRVTERERTLTGDFIDRSKRSRNVQITVQPLRSNMTVSLSSNSTEVEEGRTIQLTCEAHSVLDKATGLSVTWRWADGKGGAKQDLAALDGEGVAKPGPAYSERAAYGEIRVERIGPSAFLLAVHNSVPGDEGQYECAVSEWVQGTNRSWEKMGEKSATKSMSVKAVESSFSVSASSRKPSVTYGDSFDLQCIVKPRHNPRVPAAVTWRFKSSEGAGDAPFQDLVTFSHDGTLQWSKASLGMGARTTVDRTGNVSNFRLSISRAGPGESGTYRCLAQLWRRTYNRTWAKVAERTSNPLGINVVKPAPKLRLHQSNQSVVLVEDGRVQINCSILAQTSAESQHTVLWFARRGAPDEAGGPSEGGEAQAELLLKINHNSAFEYGAYAEEERLQSRVQAERLSAQLHRLTLHRTEAADSGTYFCLVEEWLPDPSGAWYLLAREASGFTRVVVKQPEVRLQVEETESNVTVQESSSFRLGCSIPSQSSRESRFSVSWYVARAGRDGAEDCVFSIGHDAVFGNGNCSPSEAPGPDSRLRFERTTSDLYSLTVQQARSGDEGNYSCLVEEWLLNPRKAWYRLAASRSGVTVVAVLPQVSTLMSVVCSNESLFYFVFFYPFPIFGLLLIAVLLVRYKARGSSKSQEGKNGAPLLWIKEPHLNYSPTCLDPPTLGLHPGSVE